MMGQSAKLFSVLVLSLFGGFLTSTASAQSDADGLDHKATFDTMKSFAGTYDEVGTPETSATVTYSLMSKGSVLMESWDMASGKKELTVFHMDNGELVATHYCAANVQSTMVLASKSEDGMLNFRLRSVSNLSSPQAAHNSGFGYKFDDNLTLHRNEIWTKDGKTSLSAIVLNRTLDE